MRSVQRGPVVGVGALVTALVVLQASVRFGPSAWVIAVTCAIGAGVLLARAMRHHGAARLGPADWVTLTRAVLGQVVTALVVESFAGREHRGLIVSLTVIALALDAVDGRVARATGTMSALGARFDMEVDAFLILVLSVASGPILGWWVLVIGAARYALMLSEVFWPWLRAPVPQRYWRKVVAAVQGIVLTAVVAQALPHTVMVGVTVVATTLLAESFGRDVWWLRRHQAALPQPQPRTRVADIALPAPADA